MPISIEMANVDKSTIHVRRVGAPKNVIGRPSIQYAANRNANQSGMPMKSPSTAPFKKLRMS